MKNEVTVNGKSFPIREYHGVRVVTLKDIDSLHERPEGTARKRFNDNQEHFIENEDFFRTTCDEVRPFFGQTTPNGYNPNAEIILITESGYLMLVKSFRDDLAWSVQRELVNKYFVAVEAENDRSDMTSDMQEAFTQFLGQMCGEEMVQNVASVILDSIHPILTDIMKRINSLERRVSALESHRIEANNVNSPSANMLLADSRDLNTITSIATHYDMDAISMNKLLEELGVQFKDDDNVWKLTYKYVANEYVKYRQFANSDCPKTMYWTRAGLVFIYNFLAERNIYPKF